MRFAVTGEPIALTQVNAGLGDLTLARSESVHWKGPGGRVLDGVLTYPLHYSADHAYPLVLNIHGLVETPSLHEWYSRMDEPAVPVSQ